MKRRTLYVGTAAVVLATTTTGGVMAQQDDAEPTFGPMPTEALEAMAANTEPGLLDPSSIALRATAAAEIQADFEVPDYIEVVNGDDVVVGYVPSSEVLGMEAPPANPREALRQQRERQRLGDPGQEVVDRDLNVIGHLGPKGFVPLGD